jgi:uncharacterized protein
MLAKLFPKEKDFFPIFDQMTAGLSAAVSELLGVIDNPEGIEKAVLKTRTLDTQAEHLARQTVRHLHETFITPFDRKHIFQFVVQVGHLNSLTRLVTEKLQAFEIKKLPLELIELTGRCGEVCAVLKQIVGYLQKIKHPENVLKSCIEIYKIRSTAEILAFNFSNDLYTQETDMKTLMKLKEITEDLVSMIRKFEGIFILIEEIVLEYA